MRLVVVLLYAEVRCLLQSLGLRLTLVLQLDDLPGEEGSVHALVLFFFSLGLVVGLRCEHSLSYLGRCVMDRACTAHPAYGPNFALLLRNALRSVPVAAEGLDSSMVRLLVWIRNLLRALDWQRRQQRVDHRCVRYLSLVWLSHTRGGRL